jgi:hypothetical protein
LAGVVVLLVVLAIWGVTNARAAAAQPGQVAARYCAALLARDYAGAAHLLTPAALAGATTQQFVADEQVRESIDGRVTSCQTGSAASGLFGALSFMLSSPHQATVPLALTRAHLGSRSGTLTLARVGAGWIVAGMSAPVQGTSLAPLHAANSFCAALAAGKYTDAYADLSTRQQQMEKTMQQFTTQATQPAGASFTGCTPDYASYAVTNSSATITLTLNVHVALASSSPTIPIAATMTLVQQGAAWKVDGLDIVKQG